MHGNVLLLLNVLLNCLVNALIVDVLLDGILKYTGERQMNKDRETMGKGKG